MESVFGYKQKISFVSTFCLGRRLYVIDHATISVDHEINYLHATNRSAVEVKVNVCRVGKIL